MKEDKWVQRWIVQSSSGSGVYTVGKDVKGNWGCSCIGWTRRVKYWCPFCRNEYKPAEAALREHRCCGQDLEMIRPDCRHILEVQGGGGKTISEATVERMLGRLP